MRPNPSLQEPLRVKPRKAPELERSDKMNIPSMNHITAIDAVEDPVLQGRYSEIIISNPKKEIRLGCDRNSDEILLSAGRKKQRKKLYSIFRGDCHIDWMWTMTNQQGYFDGFRIQISAPGIERVFEFISIGSCLDVYESKKPNKPVDAMARSPVVKPTSTAPTHHL